MLLLLLSALLRQLPDAPVVVYHSGHHVLQLHHQCGDLRNDGQFVPGGAHLIGQVVDSVLGEAHDAANLLQRRSAARETLALVRVAVLIDHCLHAPMRLCEPLMGLAELVGLALLVLHPAQQQLQPLLLPDGPRGALLNGLLERLHLALPRARLLHSVPELLEMILACVEQRAQRSELHPLLRHARVHLVHILKDPVRRRAQILQALLDHRHLCGLEVLGVMVARVRARAAQGRGQGKALRLFRQRAIFQGFQAREHGREATILLRRESVIHVVLQPG
mmetsp:Transcript_143104/g.457289  ORF Transcript_143104/g.457289 Transcript_143104/m.457289 type:complete len:278 (+) Transcript_143104:2154-2987(+)